MLDVMFGTNIESRPLGVTAAMDDNLNVFTPIRIFMPSQCQWVFDWIIATALASLLGEDSLQSVQIFLTDGDSKMYNAFDKFKEDLFISSDNTRFVTEEMEPESLFLTTGNLVIGSLR